MPLSLDPFNLTRNEPVVTLNPNGTTRLPDEPLSCEKRDNEANVNMLCCRMQTASDHRPNCRKRQLMASGAEEIA
ncbi:hypothetical protein CJF30_00004652 [Rutstroemia sp. NJR-2017a BBW]|nr:hypothetical protein CJF30_00004652 [Rutstroemia sp. NJR-2017a BBW]